MKKKFALAAIALVAAVGLTACGGGSKGEAGPSIDLELSDFKISPAEIKIPAGKAVTLSITNNGVQPHNVAILGAKAESKLLSAGGKGTLKVTLAKGTPPLSALWPATRISAWQPRWSRSKSPSRHCKWNTGPVHVGGTRGKYCKEGVGWCKGGIPDMSSGFAGGTVERKRQ